jgi:hypothetical protein
MKRKLFFGLAGLAFVVAAAITTISTITANTYESDLLTKNIEVLTRNEIDGMACIPAANCMCTALIGDVIVSLANHKNTY